MAPTLALALFAFAAAPDELLLVEFSSPACAACRAMEPVVSRLEAAGVRVQHIDAQQNAELAQQYGVRVLPTFFVLARGREPQRLEGAVEFEKLAGLLAQAGQGVPPQKAANAAPDLIVRGQDPGNGFPGGAIPAAPPRELPAGVTPFALARQMAQPSAGQALAAIPGAAATGPGGNEAVRRVMERALLATIRLKIEDGQGMGFGTGTVIDRHNDESLVLTCGHLFRGWKNDGKISADLHDVQGRPIGSAPGQLIAFNLDHDVALVSIRAANSPQPMPVAPPGFVLRPGDRVFSLGCDKGGQPSVRASHVNAVNRFNGEPNVTVAGQPVDGRSGGGLFTEDGYLVGVCNAANAKDDEGLYAALPSIHWQLDSIGQAAIYKRNATGGGNLVGNAPATAAPARLPAGNPGLSSAPAAVVSPASFAQPVAPQPAFAPPAVASAPPAQQVQPAPQAPAGLPSDTEVIVIMRSKSNPQQESRVFVVDNIPAEWLHQMAGAARPLSPDVVNPQRFTTNPPAAPIVRGQSQ